MPLTTFARSPRARRFRGFARWAQAETSRGTAKLLTGKVPFNDSASFMQRVYDSHAAGTPSTIQHRFWSYQAWGFYAQDDVRAASRLTLNLAFRYEFQSVPRERPHQERR